VNRAERNKEVHDFPVDSRGARKEIQRESLIRGWDKLSRALQGPCLDDSRAPYGTRGHRNFFDQIRFDQIRIRKIIITRFKQSNL
jgi:hypothetical protein